MNPDPQDPVRIDLIKLQDNYFNASLENAREANSAVKYAQNWIVILGLAEMSFLGILLFQEKYNHVYLKVVLALLLFGLVLFLIGSVRQYKHLVRVARHYRALSIDVNAEIKEKGRIVDEVPTHLTDNLASIRSDKYANLLIYVTLTIIVVSTLSLIFSIFFI
jgi:hypothetical protein